MKSIYMIGGTMGVGKTTVCQLLKMKLPKTVFLDGDWCWDAYPFQVTDETIAMVQNNICHMLNNFIHCSAYENVIFCWVMHEQSIIDELLNQMDTIDCTVKTISLVCSEKALRERLKKDVERGIRTEDVIERSVSRIPLYQRINSIIIDTTDKIPDTIVAEILTL